MSENEFLARLKEALENDLDSRAVQEQLAYYRSYISEQRRMGKTEGEVMEELGDPWVIAQSIINMAELKRGTAKPGESWDENQWEGDGYHQRARGYTSREVHSISLDAWWKKLLLLLGVLGIVFIVFAVIGGLISLILPLVFPVLVVVLVVRLIRGMR